MSPFAGSVPRPQSAGPVRRVPRRVGDETSDDLAVTHPELTGFGHIDFTVTDVDRSARWWQAVMGFTLVAQQERPGFKVWNLFHPSFLAVGLVAFDDPASARFDERSIGLDHLALRVPDRAALEAWQQHFDALGVAHSGIQEENGGPLIVFRDPDNIQLELWAFDWDLVRPSRTGSTTTYG